MAQSRTTKSPIWTDFGICDDDKSKALCKICGERIPRGGKSAKGFRGVGNRKSFNTTYLRRHLQHHPEENKKLVVAENVEKERQQAQYLAHSSMASTCQTTVAQCFERQKSSSCYSSYIGRLGACILLCWECCHSNLLLP